MTTRAMRAGDSDPLTPKQRRFITEYLVDLCAAQAAIRAGYSPATANRAGTRLLSHAVIAAEIVKAKAARAERTAIEADHVVRRLYETAERCLGHAPGPDGAMAPFDPRAAVAALKLLGLHQGLFTAKVELRSAQASGVLMVPVPMAADSWAIAAEAQQEALAARTRQLAQQYGV